MKAMRCPWRRQILLAPFRPDASSEREHFAPITVAADLRPIIRVAQADFAKSNLSMRAV
jgi:hypothetical protein